MAIFQSYPGDDFDEYLLVFFLFSIINFCCIMIIQSTNAAWLVIDKLSNCNLYVRGFDTYKYIGSIFK